MFQFYQCTSTPCHVRSALEKKEEEKTTRLTYALFCSFKCENPFIIYRSKLSRF